MKFKRLTKPPSANRIATPMSRNHTRLWWHAAVLFGLLLANFALYHGTFGLGFLSVDDPDYVQNDPYIEGLNWAKLKHVLTTAYTANYAPATLLSYALDVALAGGKDAFAIHLSNVLWHGWVVCMVYLLAFTIRPNVTFAAAAGLLFLLHPAHVEVVAWISGRKDLVATGFAALSMTCYLLSRSRPTHRSWWYAASIVSFLLASAGKQSVLLLPAVMLVWDFLVEQRRNWRMLADKIPFALITIFFGWMTWRAQPSTNQAPQAFVLAATQFVNFWLLAGFGDYVLFRPAPDPASWSQAARLVTIVAAALVWALPPLWHHARQPVRTALSYWVLIQMVPPMVLGFIVPITDRYLFLPSVGVCILFANLAVGLTTKLRAGRWICLGLLACLAAVWSMKTWNYLGEWRDPRSVWYGTHFKTTTPQVSQYLGEVYQNAGDRIHSFIKSGTPLGVTNELRLAHAVLGDAAQVERLHAEWLGAKTARTNSIGYRDLLWDLAWKQYGEALSRRGRLSTPNLFMARGKLLVSQGKFESAISEFRNALRFAEASRYERVRQEIVTHALYAIGVAHWNLRDYKQAEQWILKAQSVQRESGQVWIATLDQDCDRIRKLVEGQP